MSETLPSQKNRRYGRQIIRRVKQGSEASSNETTRAVSAARQPRGAPRHAGPALNRSTRISLGSSTYALPRSLELLQAHNRSRSARPFRRN